MSSNSRQVSPKVAQGEATRAQIMQTAERLFAKAGYHSVPLRRVAAEAGVQLPLLVYHFGSKEGLYRAIFEKHVRSIISKRSDDISDLLERSERLSVREILEEFSRPWLDLFKQPNNDAARLFARSFFEHSELQMELIERPLDKQAGIFIEALQSAAPRAPRDEIHRCYHLFVANQLFHILEHARIARISGSAVADLEKSLQFVSGVIAGQLERYSARP